MRSLDDADEGYVTMESFCNAVLPRGSTSRKSGESLWRRAR